MQDKFCLHSSLVLCIPVGFTNLTDQHADKLQDLDTIICTKLANSKQYAKQLLLCAGCLDSDTKSTGGVMVQGIWEVCSEVVRVKGSADFEAE